MKVSMFRCHPISGIFLLASTSVAFSAMQFTDVTTEANILHTHAYEPIESIALEDYAQISGGAVAEDFNGDGWIDLYVLQGGDSPNLLYINQKDGTFSDEASARGAGLTGPYMGACAADYDADGDIDIFISGAEPPHSLLINDGTGSFTVDQQQIDQPLATVTSPSWGDIDNDGLLELSLGSWRFSRTPIPEDFLQIYRNVGDGQLEPYITLRNDWDYIPRFLDIDNDRLQDLLLVADFGSTRWFRNFGNGIFLQAGTSDIENGMGSAVGDIDNDGDLDVFMTSIRLFDSAQEVWLTTGNRLLLNNGTGGFTDITEESGVRDGGWGWGAEMADFDNDGDLDIFHVNGWGLNNPPGTFNQLGTTPSRLFENTGDNVFEEIAELSGDAADTGQGRCAIAFDYDNDGDMDIFIANNSIPVGGEANLSHEPAPPVLLRNDTVNTNNFINIRLEGTNAPHHTDGIGARVYIQTGETEQMRELHASSGFNGHGPGRIAHFGLGTSTTVDQIRARWTTGDETEIRNVDAGQNIVLKSPQATLSKREILPGEEFTAAFPAEALPEGATAMWTINGVEYTNPATLALAEPGEYLLKVSIFTGDQADGLEWSESLLLVVASTEVDERSVARKWNEQNLAAIRIDFPDPTKHARNLFASSVAMWDTWAAYDSKATGLLHNESATAEDIDTARNEAISHAAYRVLVDRYKDSVNASTTLISLNNQMLELGYDPLNTGTAGSTPAALGNRVAASVIAYTSSDGWDDVSGFLGEAYTAVNDPLPVAESGTTMDFPNRWQPLLFEEAFTQNQQTTDLVQSFLGPNWGAVRPFAFTSFQPDQILHLDPGPPPQLGTATDSEFKDGNLEVIYRSSLLGPDTNEMIDISPGAIGNNTLGLNDGTGYPLNPYTGEPYAPNMVNHADFGRVLAEFWADGPDSETPPGHWNTLANELYDHPEFIRQFEGTGPELDPLEWDVKVYFAMNGALHDAAIAAWGCKRVYDYVRPISSIRYMGQLGQSSEPQGPAYDPMGLPLVPGLVEVITEESSASGQRHDHLAAHVGKVAIKSWSAGENETLGVVDWMLPADWLPYQRDTFVTPAFPGYVSGHSTFSRAAAEVLARMTGSEFFPGGMETFTAHENEFLEFEPGPTMDVVLQWATYFDAADQAGLSRLYGGIHVPADDGPGRIMGSIAGIQAWELATQYFDGSITGQPMETQLSFVDPNSIQLDWTTIRGAFYKLQESSNLESGIFTDSSDWIWAGETIESNLLPVPPALEPRKFYRVIRTHQSPAAE
ncbi:hypothetical protein G0Q06_00725 [Puniceicoccales bacterium CK1056]|uniref:Uncharacterized protein n=1 Tax=Oceanipulchritudo coccoides TaxID=2706888 RepID=A0A6B2LYX3_9BACT|nr:FG-GAP-like repeat-containing protein [Oceanipulchritudo coccoides]NDV60967.1 hypothetical protein [Oceanipulchritudo coccoides]